MRRVRGDIDRNYSAEARLMFVCCLFVFCCLFLFIYHFGLLQRFSSTSIFTQEPNQGINGNTVASATVL